jgi:putative endonuclease
VVEKYSVEKYFFMKLGHNYYIYIVECNDWSYYIGITNDLDRRLWEHNTGFDPGCYTYERRPVELRYFEHFTDVNQATSREKQLKGWSRKKKQALFRENWNELKRLSKSSVIKIYPSDASKSSA